MYLTNPRDELTFRFAMPKPKIQFVTLRDDPKRRALICGCGNTKFFVLNVKMARQKKTVPAHHMRVVAKCTRCEDERRIGFRR